MKYILAGFALILCAMTSTFASADETGIPEVIAERYSLQSAILDEERLYWVSLPKNYDNPLYASTSYPVIYILDGISYYPLASSMVHTMSRTENIPEAIVVAIDTSKNRTRDLTPNHSLLDWQLNDTPAFATSGGGDKFLAFLKSELIPHIEKTYRTAPHRTLVGHSLGGLTVAHSLLTQPGLFQGYVSIDGSQWWDNQLLVRKLQTMPPQKNMTGRLFFSLADHETTGPGELTNMIVGNIKFVDLLEKIPSPDLHVKLQMFDDETHGSVGLPSLYYGLRYVFEGHRLKYGWAKDINDLVRHYETLSKRYGFTYQPPEKTVDGQARYAAYKPRNDAATTLGFLQWNVAHYPLSSHAHSSLADHYRDMKEMQKAAKHYKKALELNEKNVTARKGLELLKQ